ncbi:MAG: hypothetical protein ACQESN_11460 [Thermotogota bacterium]
MVSKNEPVNKLSPKDYRAYLEKIELDSISLSSCSVLSDKKKLGSQKGLSIDIGDSTRSDGENSDKACIFHEYDLTAYYTNKTEYLVKIEAVYELVFTLEEKFPDEFWDIFYKVNLSVNTWPYFRELVQNMTQRLNIPPLTLPFYR